MLVAMFDDEDDAPRVVTGNLQLDWEYRSWYPWGTWGWNYYESETWKDFSKDVSCWTKALTFKAFSTDLLHVLLCIRRVSWQIWLHAGNILTHTSWSSWHPCSQVSCSSCNTGSSWWQWCWSMFDARSESVFFTGSVGRGQRFLFTTCSWRLWSQTCQ